MGILLQDLRYPFRGFRRTPGIIAVIIISGVGVGQLLRSQQFGISPSDSITFGVIAALLIGVALLASWLPARRAARIDPLVALKSE